MALPDFHWNILTNVVTARYGPQNGVLLLSLLYDFVEWLEDKGWVYSSTIPGINNSMACAFNTHLRRMLIHIECKDDNQCVIFFEFENGIEGAIHTSPRVNITLATKLRDLKILFGTHNMVWGVVREDME